MKFLVQMISISETRPYSVNVRIQISEGSPVDYLPKNILQIPRSLCYDYMSGIMSNFIIKI